MSDKPQEDDIERIQLFEACQVVEETLRRLNGKPVTVYISVVEVVVEPLFGHRAEGQSLFDAIIAAKERSGA